MERPPLSDPTPELEARLNHSIRRNYLDLAPSALAFALVTLAATAIVFWDNASPNRVALWALVQGMLLGLGIAITAKVSSKNFLRTAVINEATQAAWWAMFPVMALATTADWQVYQGLLIVGLMLSTLGNSTASRPLHLASTVPLALIGAAAFTLRGDGAAQWMVAAITIALTFTLSAGSVLRQVQADLFASSLKNENLASSLRTEGDRLKAANDQLETVNTDLDDQSRRDALTGLYNRSGFTTLLNEAVEKSNELVVSYLDLDRFKRVNDAFGHRFGDLVLQAAADRISQVLRPDEVLARLGGDEMTLLSSASCPADVEEIGERILSVFERPFSIESRRIEIRVTAGLVWLGEPTTADDLMRFADTALYQAKENGRARYEIFDDQMRGELDFRTRLQADLGLAFERSEITPYLQPIIDIHSGQIYAAEALARWKHPEGLRSAFEFIDTARHLGVLDQINSAVASQVFDFQRLMHANGQPACPITVNTSPIHLEEMLNRVLAEPDIDPVVIEITEDGIFSDLDTARRLINRAREADINVLLDDFGVGFSSLSIATELPIDGFKIDRGFVASLAGNPSALAAVEAIIQLAQRMDLRVVAEGVETVEQLHLLRRLGVNYAQGYLFSEAVPMDSFASWLYSERRFDVYRATADN